MIPKEMTAVLSIRASEHVAILQAILFEGMDDLPVVSEIRELLTRIESAEKRELVREFLIEVRDCLSYMIER